MDAEQPIPAQPLADDVTEQCDALRAFYLLHTYAGSSRPRRPRMVEALLRCRRQLGHTGEHRHADVRQWDDDHNDGWIDEGENEPVPDDVCACGHARRDHIYDEHACRPGFRCEHACEEFDPAPTANGAS